MRRTQLYLEEDLWEALKVQSRQSRLTVSELVRQAVRSRYLDQTAKRKQAMMAFAGIRRGRPEFGDAGAYIRKLRRGSRMDRLAR